MELYARVQVLLPGGHKGLTLGAALGLAGGVTEFALMETPMAQRVALAAGIAVVGTAAFAMFIERWRDKAWADEHPAAARLRAANVHDAIFDDRDALRRVQEALEEAGDAGAYERYVAAEAALEAALEETAGDDGFGTHWPMHRPVTRTEARLVELRTIRTMHTFPVHVLLDVLALHLHPDEGLELVRAYENAKAESGELRALSLVVARVRRR